MAGHLSVTTTYSRYRIFTSVRASDAGPWDTFVTCVGVNQLREAYTGQ